MPSRDPPVAASTARKLKETIADLEKNCNKLHHKLFDAGDKIDNLRAENTQLEHDSLTTRDRIAAMQAEIDRLKTQSVQIAITPIVIREVVEPGGRVVQLVNVDAPIDPSGRRQKSTFFSVPGKTVTAWFQCNDDGYQIEIKSPP